MRSQLETIHNDDTNNCFICNIPREKFERFGIDFTRHNTIEHNKNIYIWLKLHLTEKPKEDFTWHETYVWSLINSKKISYIPIGQSVAFNKKEKEQEDTSNELIL